MSQTERNYRVYKFFTSLHLKSEMFSKCESNWLFQVAVLIQITDPDCYTLVSKSRIISKSLTSENDTFITADDSSHM